jgi:hypothetical protein
MPILKKTMVELIIILHIHSFPIGYTQRKTNYNNSNMQDPQREIDKKNIFRELLDIVKMSILCPKKYTRK